jgi:hypothetical protein
MEDSAMTIFNDIPVLSIAGLNTDEPKKNFIKNLMIKSFKNNLVIDIKLAPEPTNPYDAGAIKIVINDFHIGYIAKVDQKYFDFSKGSYVAQIVSWGVLKDQSAYVYIQPVFKECNSVV